MRGNIQNSSQCRDWGLFFRSLDISLFYFYFVIRGWETQSQNKKSTNHSDKNKNKIAQIARTRHISLNHNHKQSKCHITVTKMCHNITKKNLQIKITISKKCHITVTKCPLSPIKTYKKSILMSRL